MHANLKQQKDQGSQRENAPRCCIFAAPDLKNANPPWQAC